MNDVSLFSLISSPLLSFVVTFSFIFWLIKYSNIKILDHPNHRSLHTESVHRTGGIGLISGILAGGVVLPAILPWSVWTGISVLALVSIIDDILSLPVWSRLLVHCAVAILVSVAMLFEDHSWLIVSIAALFILWMTNLYNFMDGSDGLAGGMTLFGFGFYGLAALFGESEIFAMINFSISSAAIAFLFFNFYPARVFMGDAGSIPLGFLAAVLGILGWIDSLWPAWFPLLVFSPFIVDASVTLIKRCLHGKRIWQAHREHYYQQLVKDGLGHRSTALLWYALMLSVGASAVWVVQQEFIIQLGTGIVWSIVYLLLIVVCEQYRKQGKSDIQNTDI
jgi:UDP-N-acetylmuramyl pentapeptide phosphotransferase/UDP-N-acetylglucosamine-1-phosphate transferase